MDVRACLNVKPSTVPTILIHELYAHTRITHPERFLGAETLRRPNTQQHVGAPFILAVGRVSRAKFPGNLKALQPFCGQRLWLAASLLTTNLQVPKHKYKYIL
jgi:hypothetical protein